MNRYRIPEIIEREYREPESIVKVGSYIWDYYDKSLYLRPGNINELRWDMYNIIDREIKKDTMKIGFYERGKIYFDKDKKEIILAGIKKEAGKDNPPIHVTFDLSQLKEEYFDRVRIYFYSYRVMYFDVMVEVRNGFRTENIKDLEANAYNIMRDYITKNRIEGYKFHFEEVYTRDQISSMGWKIVIPLTSVNTTRMRRAVKVE